MGVVKNENKGEFSNIASSSYSIFQKRKYYLIFIFINSPLILIFSDPMYSNANKKRPRVIWILHVDLSDSSYIMWARMN